MSQHQIVVLYFTPNIACGRRNVSSSAIGIQTFGGRIRTSYSENVEQTRTSTTNSFAGSNLSTTTPSPASPATAGTSASSGANTSTRSPSNVQAALGRSEDSNRVSTNATAPALRPSRMRKLRYVYRRRYVERGRTRIDRRSRGNRGRPKAQIKESRKSRRNRRPCESTEEINFAPAPSETDGEASNPGHRLRRRGPRSDEAEARRYISRIQKQTLSEQSQEERRGSEKSQDTKNLSGLNLLTLNRSHGIGPPLKPETVPDIHIRRICKEESEKPLAAEPPQKKAKFH